MPFVISKDPIEGDFDSDTESKFVIGGEVTPDGAPIYGEDDILTKAGWRYRKKTTDTDMVKGAAEAVKGLWNGFAKIPDVVRAKGFTGASGNLPEAMLAAGEGWKDIVKSVASKNYAVVTGMSEEQDLDRQYANYREVAERSVEQVKRSRSRVGDFFRAIGAPEHAATMDESIDQDVANSLSMVLDPTNIIGGGSLKALLAAGKGGKVAVAGEKAAVAGEKALQAAETVGTEAAEKTAKGFPPIGDGPAPINFIEAPSAAVTGALGEGAENVGKFGTSVGEKLADWQKANPLAAPIASAALAGYGSDWDPLAIIGGAVAPSAIKASATKLKLAGEAAQVAAVASREGIDVAAKSGIAGEKVSAIAKRLDTPAVNFLLSQSAQLADAVVRGSVIGGGLGYATGNDPEVSAVGSGIGAGIVGGTMGRLQSIGIDQTGRVAFHRPDADGKWVRVSESPAALARDQDLAVSFLASRSLPERTVLAGRLNIAELAELARGEAAAKGANRATGSDMEVRFLDADGMVAAGFDPTVAKVMQGVTETDQKPTLYVNLDVATDPAYTLWHEGMHGFDRLAPDEVGGKQTDAGAALEQTRAELKAFYFGSYDASGKQTSPGKYDGAQFLKLEDQYLSRVGMSEAEMTAHMGQPMSKRVAYIADEMAAEAAGMLGRLSGGDIGKASRYPSTALGRAALGVLARTRIGLESLGIVFDGGGDVVTSGIFKDPTTGKRLELSSDVREKLAAYLRAKDKITTRMSIDFDESPITEVVNARDLAKASTTPETLARWKNSGMFALDDKGEIRMMGGKPVFLTAAERKKVDANRSLAIFTAIKAVPDDGSPGLRSEVIDGVETFKGTKLSKAQVDAVLALPDAVLPPSVKARISELVKLQEDAGAPVIADYNKALTGGRYDSKASISTQIFVPMSLSISAAGNFLVSSFSVVGYERKVAMWKKTKKKFFEPWDGNMDSFHNDVRTYLNNQESGAGNVAVGKEAITKKNAINDFLASVLVGDMNRVSTKSNSDNLIRSFRVDRMQSIERAGGDNMPYDYGKVRANFMPADGADEVTLSSVRTIDALGNKSASQANPASLKYPQNPVEVSVVLPPRWGFVNKNITGMPRAFADVQDIASRTVARIKRVVEDSPVFAKESARFYSDMSDSADILADVTQPGVTGLEKALLSELMLRYLSLGSPRTSVTGNATKSSGSAAGYASGHMPGVKLGFGPQQIGARETHKAWQKGQHFDLDMPGIDDKVRSFYINGISESIENLTKAGDDASARELMLRAGKSLHLIEEGVKSLTDADVIEIQRHLDGKVTVDMWDMAAKGFAWPGFILRRSQRNKAEQPFQWSQDKFSVDATLADKRWETVTKDLGVENVADLRYQQARALRVDGNLDWTEKTWGERVKQPFPPETKFTYFTEGSEAGLTPGGAGPMYDAQQGIDGLLADSLNRAGLAPLFGKEKLKARNAQEILWALEKLDNPIKSNNDLSLFGDSFGPLMQTVNELRLGKGLTKRARAEAVLDAMDRAFNKMATQEMPVEVVTSGTSAYARLIQNKLDEMTTAGIPKAAEVLTNTVADGLGDWLNDLSTLHNLDFTVDSVNVGFGGYSEGANVSTSPNFRMMMRGNPKHTRFVLEALSVAMDQDGGNIIRMPTVRELNDVNVKKNFFVTFDTRGFDAAKRDALFMDLHSIKDQDGNSFLTGFTETEEGMAIGDQFYRGNMKVQFDANKDKIDAAMKTHGVQDMSIRKLIVDTFRRSDKPPAASRFASDVAKTLHDKIAGASTSGSFPQRTEALPLLQKRASDSISAADNLGKTARAKLFVDLNSAVDVALLLGQIDQKTGLSLKETLKDPKLKDATK